MNMSHGRAQILRHRRPFLGSARVCWSVHTPNDQETPRRPKAAPGPVRLFQSAIDLAKMVLRRLCSSSWDFTACSSSELIPSSRRFTPVTVRSS
jgi:hypothetical protein